RHYCEMVSSNAARALALLAATALMGGCTGPARPRALPSPTPPPVPTPSVTAAVVPSAAPDQGMSNLEDLFFPTPTHGLAALGVTIVGGPNGLSGQGSGGVSRTVDGGAHWTPSWTSAGTGVAWVGAAGSL